MAKGNLTGLGPMVAVPYLPLHMCRDYLKPGHAVTAGGCDQAPQ